MLHALVADVQPRRAALPATARRIYDTRPEGRELIGAVAKVSNACRLAGVPFAVAFAEYGDLYAAAYREGRHRWGNREQVRRWAQQDWDRLTRKAGTNVYGAAAWTEWFTQMREAVLGSTLSSPVDQLLLLQIVAVAAHQQSPTAVVTITALAQHLGLARQTIITAQKRCESAGLLDVERPGPDPDTGLPRANRLTVAGLEHWRSLRGAAGDVEPVALLDRPLLPLLGGPAGPGLQHDAFTGIASLGPRGVLLVQALAQGAWRRRDLAARLKCDRVTLWRLLKKAALAGIIDSYVLDGEVVITLSQLLLDATTSEEVAGIFDCAAADLGTTGAQERLRERLARHRAWLQAAKTAIKRDWEIYRLKLATLRT